MQPATTLILFPQRKSFEASWSCKAQQAVADTEAEAPVQVLVFHPHAMYSDNLDAADWSTKPMATAAPLRDNDVIVLKPGGLPSTSPA